MLKCKGNLSLLIVLAVYAWKTGIMLLVFSSVFISESEWSQLAYVTFKDSQGADTAVLLSVCSNSCNSFLALAISFPVVLGWSYLLFHAISFRIFYFGSIYGLQ